MTDSALMQAAYTTILQHFVDSGRAPHYSELAELLRIDINIARQLQREVATFTAPVSASWLTPDTDNIESWSPFSNVPTHYLISVDGAQKWYGQ